MLIFSSSGGSRPASPVETVATQSVETSTEVTPTLHDVAAEQATLIQNEEETFALAPVDSSSIRGKIIKT